MSALTCSLSGNPLIHGVISSKTGHLFEKSTILKQISTYGLCPHTNQPLSREDLVDLSITNPSITQGFSDPSKIMEKIKSQYEGLVVEAYYIKKSLGETREELAHELYKQDAEIRVIAKLQEEIGKNRDEIGRLMSEISLIENS